MKSVRQIAMRIKNLYNELTVATFNALIFLFGAQKKINKAAFIINEEYMYDHYEDVLELLDKDNFDVLLYKKFKKEGYKNFLSQLKSKRQNYVFWDDVFYRYKYKILISHVYLGGGGDNVTFFSSRLKHLISKFEERIFPFGRGSIIFKDECKIYPQKILGEYNIRFMYGLDYGDSKFGQYNSLFDEFFCHGPRDSDYIERKFNKNTFEMGYPRYDKYFARKKKEGIKKELIAKAGCDEKKKTILWICTTSHYFSTIELFWECVEKLSDQYNVLLRPHPLEIDKQYSRFRQKVLDIATSKNFLANLNPFEDLSDLYLISDFVICDYGGSIFSALYMNKNVVLLNHPDVSKDEGIYDSTSMEVREFLPSVDIQDCQKLKEYFSDKDLLKETIERRKVARQFYFGSVSELSAMRCAQRISRINEEIF